MSRRFLFIICLLFSAVYSFAQSYTFKGRVLDGTDKSPIEFAMVYLSNNIVWAVTDENGAFTLEKVPAGKITLYVQCMGYAKRNIEFDVQKDMLNLRIVLQEDNLKLNEVVITAQKGTDDLTTSYTIDHTTLEHAQILNVSDISALLPGGKTQADDNLASSDNRFSLRSGTSSELGNASFGTAVEVDGVRLQNNSAMDEIMGVDTRNVSSTNIESVEVVTGIPSVEYGDLSNGIVKINTMKGRTPFTVVLSAKPHTKQVALNKGFALGGGSAGLLNVGAEYTKSVSSLASPHTAYERKALNLTYTTPIKNAVGPLNLTVGFSGNIGGYDSSSDPDTFSEAYTKQHDYAFRGNFKLDWLLNKSWISNIELSGSINYQDKKQTVNTNKSSASTQAQIHSTEEGYFIATDYDEDPAASIILGSTGYWYEKAYTDSKPISYTLKLKADWVHRFGSLTNKLMIGAEYTRTGNNGKGLYYDDMRYAPTWRAYPYKDLPFMNNYSFYGEDKVTLPVGKLSTLQLIGGVRSDMTVINGSDYGTVSAFAPRFSGRFTFWEKKKDWFVSDLSIYAGWGKSVKLPSFEVLYPQTSYTDKLAFTPGSTSDGTAFYAYYTTVTTPLYNSDLKWQNTRQTDIGLEAKIKGVKVSVSAFRNLTHNPYISTNVYTPYSYNYTSQSSLEDCEIPSANRKYTIDQQTGIVTVTDITGTYNTRTLDYTTKRALKSQTFYTNGSTIERKGVDWIVDFPQIPALRTSFRLDGNFYFYRGVEQALVAYSPVSQQMTSGDLYQYVGYYVGSSSVANGSLSRQINANLTVTTHVPKVRLIVSLKLEGNFYHYTKSLSSWSGGNRSYALASADDYLSSNTDIYAGDQYVITYPLYYSTWENPDEKINFLEKFQWAKENDTELYNDLSKLVVKSNTSYYFNGNKISSYYSANLSVTKEIGNIASISFYATNFFNNMKLVKASNTGTKSSLYNSSYIPKFYYGLSLRLKL